MCLPAEDQRHQAASEPAVDAGVDAVAAAVEDVSKGKLRFCRSPPAWQPAKLRKRNSTGLFQKPPLQRLLRCQHLRGKRETKER